MNTTEHEAHDPTNTDAPPRARIVRAVFALYAAALLVATHWPRLAIDGPIERPDLVIHLGAFGLWTLLLIACAFFGRALGARNVLISAAIAALYAPLDELSQSIPALHRVAAVDDALANLLGVALAAGLALALGALTRP